MAPTIHSLLKRRPVNLKENLTKLANILNIKSDEKTVTALQNEIAENVITYPAYEQQIRDTANDILSDYKKQQANTNSQSQSQTPSQSQDLFEDSCVMETDETEPSADPILKRKNDEVCENESKIRFLDNQDTLKEEILDAVQQSFRQQKVDLQIMLDNHLEKIDDAFKTMDNDHKKALTQVFMDVVTKENKKMQQDVRHGMEYLITQAPLILKQPNNKSIDELSKNPQQPQQQKQPPTTNNRNKNNCNKNNRNNNAA